MTGQSDARGFTQARDKGALAVYAQVKAELADATARRREARLALVEAIERAVDAGVSEVSAVAAVVRVYNPNCEHAYLSEGDTCYGCGRVM